MRYSPRSTNAPVAVTELQGLPGDLRAALPSLAELEAVIDELEQLP